MRDILDNHSNYNKFVLNEGLTIDTGAVNEYTLSRFLLKKLDIVEITESVDHPKLNRLRKKIESASFDVLSEIRDMAESGMNAFDICENMESIKTDKLRKFMIGIENRYTIDFYNEYADFFNGEVFKKWCKKLLKKQKKSKSASIIIKRAIKIFNI